MARIKGGLNAKKKHNRTLKLAKGYRGARSKQYRVAKQSVMRALTSLRRKKTEKTSVQTALDRSYQRSSKNERTFLQQIHARLKVANIDMNRKMLAEMAVNDAEGFAALYTADSNTDFSVQLQKIKDGGAELVFLPNYYTDNALILQQAHDAGMDDVKKFGVDGMDGILGVENFDTSLAEGVMLLTPFSATAEDEKSQEFVKAYEDANKDAPTSSQQIHMM